MVLPMFATGLLAAILHSTEHAAGQDHTGPMLRAFGLAGFDIHNLLPAQ